MQEIGTDRPEQRLTTSRRGQGGTQGAVSLLDERPTQEPKIPTTPHGSKIWNRPVFSEHTVTTSEQEARGRGTTPISKETETDLSKEGHSQQETATIEFVTVNVFITLPLVHVLPETQN